MVEVLEGKGLETAPMLAFGKRLENNGENRKNQFRGVN